MHNHVKNMQQGRTPRLSLDNKNHLKEHRNHVHFVHYYQQPSIFYVPLITYESSLSYGAMAIAWNYFSIAQTFKCLIGNEIIDNSVLKLNVWSFRYQASGLHQKSRKTICSFAVSGALPFKKSSSSASSRLSKLLVSNGSLTSGTHGAFRWWWRRKF